MTWAESVKREFTERIQFTRNVGKNARMRSQCVPGSLKKSLGTRLQCRVQAYYYIDHVLVIYLHIGLQKTPEEMLIDNCKDLVRCTMKLLEGEVRDVTSISGKCVLEK